MKLQTEFTALADDDAKVFAPLAKAYSLPSETEEQKAYKAEVMETNLLAASAVPLQIMENQCRCLQFLTDLQILEAEWL